MGVDIGYQQARECEAFLIAQIVQSIGNRFGVAPKIPETEFLDLLHGETHAFLFIYLEIRTNHGGRSTCEDNRT